MFFQRHHPPQKQVLDIYLFSFVKIGALQKDFKTTNLNILLKVTNLGYTSEIDQFKSALQNSR